ncbi:MAG: hypothetical protein ACTTIZ_09035 [Treponema sp.]
MTKFRNLFTFLFLSFSLTLNGEYYSGNTEKDSRIMRVPVWAFLEGQPGIMEGDDASPFIPPKKALQEVSNFLLTGMSYGWEFSYTPSDARREVKEVFEIKALNELKIKKEEIDIKEVRVKYPYIYCWAEYSLSSDEIALHQSWQNLKYKTVKGIGEGLRKNETEGIKTAYTNAIKKAIREYARKTEKNKPKEIIGEVLIKNSPRLFCSSGLFKAEIELYINIKEVIPYTAF